MRTKRGHRKPSVLNELQTNNAPGSTFINQNLTTLSPSSDAFSHTLADTQSQSQKDAKDSKGSDKDGANGTSAVKEPSDAFEFYCAEMRPEFKEKAEDKDDDEKIEAELARSWKDLSKDEQAVYEERFEEEKEKQKKAKKDEPASQEAADRREGAEPSQAEDTPQPATQDEDVEMGNYDTEPDATPSGDKQAD